MHETCSHCDIVLCTVCAIIDLFMYHMVCAFIYILRNLLMLSSLCILCNVFLFLEP